MWLLFKNEAPTTCLSESTLLNKVKKSWSFSIKDMQWIPRKEDVLLIGAVQCSAGEKAKGTPPTRTDGGPGICTAKRISIPGAADWYLHRGFLLHVKSTLGNPRHGLLWSLQWDRAAQEKAVSTATTGSGGPPHWPVLPRRCEWGFHLGLWCSWTCWIVFSTMQTGDV